LVYDGFVRIVPAGLAAFYLYSDLLVNAETSRALRAYQLALQASQPPGLRDIILGYTSLLIEHDPATPQQLLMTWAEQIVSTISQLGVGQHHEIPVLYGANADKEELENRLNLSWNEIIALHQSATYTVAFTGFTPGFPYLLGLPEGLHLPRRETPRKHIPANSVAIAAGQAGIYPSDSPGGWWVLGQAAINLFDLVNEPPTLLQPGDIVKFTSTTNSNHPQLPLTKEEKKPFLPSREKERGGLAVRQAWPKSASLQSLPRWGVGHYGLAQAGALGPLAFALANQLVGNPEDAVALELLSQPLRLETLQTCTVALTGGGVSLYVNSKKQKRWQALALSQGDVVELLPDKSVSGFSSYLAVRGGFEAECYQNSFSTDARGRVGGLGRYLQTGDTVAFSPQPSALSHSQIYSGSPRYPERISLRIYPGPQFDEGAFKKLSSSSYHVDVLDRMGVRLFGESIQLPAYDVLSQGSPWGAVQVPASGQPIILLADRGRTGGYAKPAICDVRDLWKLAQAKPGTEIYFTS
jgi:KipI family sensor histidine kinase inhibitor